MTPASTSASLTTLAHAAPRKPVRYVKSAISANAITDRDERVDRAVARDAATESARR